MNVLKEDSINGETVRYCILSLVTTNDLNFELSVQIRLRSSFLAGHRS